MAFIVGKGSGFELEVSSIATAIAQITDITLPIAESETFEADTLDNANDGIPHKPTGRTEYGSVEIKGFLDPVLASFQIITDRVNNPTTPEAAVVTFADAGTTSWTMETAGTSVGGDIVMNDSVKFNASFKLDGGITYPT